MILLTSLLGVAFVGSVAAQRQHLVRSGQSLARIAKQYRVGVSELAAANGLSGDSPVTDGMVLKVPEHGVLFVGQGQTLGSIARANKVSIAELRAANRLAENATLQIGQRLVLPGYTPTRGEQRWGTPKSRGTVSLYRIWSRETLRVKLVDDAGRVRRAALTRLRDFLRPRESLKRKPPNERLLSLLAQVSDHFGGRPLHIVSGYRLPGGNTRDTSRHVAGEAIDFRIPGIPIEELRDFCQKFRNVGVGFYPRTQFVHLDVRRQNARWTDWSTAGQAAVRQKPNDVDPQGNLLPPLPDLPINEELEFAPPAPDDGQPALPDSDASG